MRVELGLWSTGSANPHPLIDLDVLNLDTVPCAQALSRLFNTPQKPGIFFKAILKPVVFGLEADQNAGRFAVARDDDFLSLSFAKESGQVILDLRKGDFLHSGLANCVSHNSVSDLATIARTSTVAPDTS
jgi:hypothetical protein